MSDLIDRLRHVKGPSPVLSKQREAAFTDRQREILDGLSTVFNEGFVHLTMAELASRMNCSLRTLYGLASSRDELVLLVADRNLWRIGRAAVNAIAADMEPLVAIRAYLSAATMAVADTTEAFARDCETVSATNHLNSEHSDYLVAVTRAMLDLAVERDQIPDVDTAAVARVVAGLGRDFARPDVLTTLRTSPKVAADAMVDTVLAGLEAQSR